MQTEENRIDLIEKLETLSKEKETALDLSNAEKIAVQTRLSSQAAKVEQLEKYSAQLKDRNDDLQNHLRQVAKNRGIIPSPLRISRIVLGRRYIDSLDFSGVHAS